MTDVTRCSEGELFNADARLGARVLETASRLAALDKQALRMKLMHGRTRAPSILAEAGCPVLMLANAEDMVLPPAGLEGVASMVANARFASIPKAGHSGYFERPAEFNRIVEGFFAGPPV